ncbi:uncharacterized protein LOC110398137 [Numida meleagris]|uniref:uncharacterized protein LOC110398137 n=1 Tax=Numida meleagris TaxID=8996 RepID=UPI000B3DA19F|nr:uncharacterized protein LOC110398137 [Numida meleagris]
METRSPQPSQERFLPCAPSQARVQDGAQEGRILLPWEPGGSGGGSSGSGKRREPKRLSNGGGGGNGGSGDPARRPRPLLRPEPARKIRRADWPPPLRCPRSGCFKSPRTEPPARAARSGACRARGAAGAAGPGGGRADGSGEEEAGGPGARGGKAARRGGAEGGSCAGPGPRWARARRGPCRDVAFLPLGRGGPPRTTVVESVNVCHALTGTSIPTTCQGECLCPERLPEDVGGCTPVPNDLSGGILLSW